MIHPTSARLTAISAAEYAERRAALKKAVGSGVIVIPGNRIAWRNADNPYPFRQSSHLLYLAPVRTPGIVLVLDADNDVDILFAPRRDPDDHVWHGPQPDITEEAASVGLDEVRDVGELAAFVAGVRESRRDLHIPPLFSEGSRGAMADWLGVAPEGVDAWVSPALVHTLGDLRLRKSEAEVARIEAALNVTAEMFDAAMQVTNPGISEAQVLAEMARVVIGRGMEFSFEPIVTVRGEVLHNHSHENILKEGQLLLIDAGVETPDGYASDITRTIPVSGAFTPQQREIYQIVLAAELAAIAEMVPGASFRNVHFRAARVISRGLTQLGLMKGDSEEAVSAGAHALFFVHGLGHPLGLDVHDVHDLGDEVAYPPNQPRSRDFGTRFLRFGRELKPGMVMTVEPGIYFIPALIDQWRSERRFEDFINYDEVERWKDFGGIRIEDDVLCTDEGTRVLGPGIPRLTQEVEEAMTARVSLR